MTEIYLHFLFAHYELYGNAPVVVARPSSLSLWRVAGEGRYPEASASGAGLSVLRLVPAPSNIAGALRVVGRLCLWFSFGASVPMLPGWPPPLSAACGLRGGLVCRPSRRSRACDMFIARRISRSTRFRRFHARKCCWITNVARRLMSKDAANEIWARRMRRKFCSLMI